MNKKTKPNRYKPEAVKDNGSRSMSGAGVFLKYVMAIGYMALFSLFSIFIYDLITQSAFFNIKKFEITGTNRVLKNDLLKLADLNHEKNILAINLFGDGLRDALDPRLENY